MSQPQVAKSDILRFLSGNGMVDYAVALTLAVTPIGASADTLFKCKDADGQVHFQDAKCVPTQGVSSRELKVAPAIKATQTPKESEGAFVLINVDSHNAYRVLGLVNDMPVQMLVDTGASFVAIPSALAAKTGVGCESAVRVSTANGTSTICKSKIKSLRIGNMVLPNVDAVVLPNAQEVLLGQSALNRLKVEQSKGVLRLSTQ